MLNPTQKTIAQVDDEVITTIAEDLHATPDRSVVGPYSVEMPEPRD